MGGIETYSHYLINYFNKFDDVESIFPKKSKPKKRALRAISMIIFSITTLYKIMLKKIDVLHLTNFNLWIIGYLYSLINRKSKIILNIWGLEDEWELDKKLSPHEAHYLKLDCSKSAERLKCRPLLSIEESLEMVSAWHKSFIIGADMKEYCFQEIHDFMKKLDI